MPEITIYTTAACPYCHRAKELLRKKGLAFTEIRVDGNPRLRAAMSAKAGGRTTVPQVFFNDCYISDCDGLYDLERAGRLDELLASFVP
jgi:glutaredoxin 3